MSTVFCIPPRNKKIIAVILGDPDLPDPVKLNGKFNNEDFATIAWLEVALSELNQFNFIFFNHHATLKKDLQSAKEKIWLVLNFCDEGYMNDPRREKNIPLLLEKMGLPYTGAGAECMELCYDKALVLSLAESREIPIPETYPEPKKARAYPIIIKPRCGDGGVGITAKDVVWSEMQLIDRLHKIGSVWPHSGILLQEFLSGPDLTCGLINGEVLPLIEEDYSVLPSNLPRIQGYEAKWQPDSPYWKVQSKLASIPEQTKVFIQDYSRQMFDCCACRDYARIDWRLDRQGLPRLLEVNPNPGWCWDGHLAKTWKLIGRSYQQMLLSIIESAARRYGLK